MVKDKIFILTIICLLFTFLITGCTTIDEKYKNENISVRIQFDDNKIPDPNEILNPFLDRWDYEVSYELNNIGNQNESDIWLIIVMFDRKNEELKREIVKIGELASGEKIIDSIVIRGPYIKRVHFEGCAVNAH